MKQASITNISDQKTKTDLSKAADDYAKNRRSSATQKAYLSDWQIFCKWALSMGFKTLPAGPETVRLYITRLAKLGRSTSTISRAIAAIKSAHREEGHTSPITPEVSDTWQGIKRELGTAPKQAKALVVKDLMRVIDAIRLDFLGRRDVALLLVGWAGALRRSEIVALNYQDVSFVSDGMILTIPKSKTDQEGQGNTIAIPWAKDKRYCAVTMLQSWISWASITGGPLFFAIGMKGKRQHIEINHRKRLTPRMVNQIIKRRLPEARIYSSGYSGHSLRAGFVTSAIEAATPEAIVQVHTRHRNFQTMRAYVRQGSLFTNNPLSALL